MLLPSNVLSIGDVFPVLFQGGKRTGEQSCSDGATGFIHPLRQWLKKKEILKISLSHYSDIVKYTGYRSHHKANVRHVLPG